MKDNARDATVAVRERGGEPYHCSTAADDERGRVRALRRRKNIGRDAVSRTFNSMRLLTRAHVADALR